MTQERIEKNRLMLEGFLFNKTIPENHKVDPSELFGYIYCIENITNGKKYIGSTYANYSGTKSPTPTIKLSKRAHQYIYEYNILSNAKSSSKRNYRHITRAMVSDGFENFIMYPLAETTRNNHVELENYFINVFDTINTGYNTNKASVGMDIIGRKLMSKEKLLRSDGIICINLNQKKILFSDSMKLFADYMDSSKDMIKNSNRKGRPYKGWFIFYIDNEKRSYVLNHFVLGDGLNKLDKHSEKSKIFYQELYTAVGLYLMDYTKSEYFSDFEKLDPLIYEDE